MRKLMAVFAAMLVLSPVFALDVGDEPAVSVRDAELRSTPGFLATITSRLDYGESVRILDARGDWFRVRATASGKEGWLHASAIAEKEALRLGVAENASSGGATSREIALAGRGFNEQVEAQYKSDKGLDFGIVDEMETYGRPVEDLAAFFAEAGLSVEDGGAE
jgi:Bacterial SH3 domain